MDLQAILSSVNETFLAVYPMLLNISAALVLLLIGWLIAKGLYTIVVRLFETIKLDKICKDIGFSELLKNGGIKRSPSELLGIIIYALSIFVAVTVVANSLGLLPAKALLSNLLSYLPKVLSAAYILGIGIFAAVLFSAVVALIAHNIGLPYSSSLVKIVKYVIIVFAILTALYQIGISPDWIVNSISLLVGAVGLALAIAFGLAGKDIAASILEDLLGKK